MHIYTHTYMHTMNKKVEFGESHTEISGSYLTLKSKEFLYYILHKENSLVLEISKL